MAIGWPRPGKPKRWGKARRGAYAPRPRPLSASLADSLGSRRPESRAETVAETTASPHFAAPRVRRHLAPLDHFTFIPSSCRASRTDSPFITCARRERTPASQVQSAVPLRRGGVNQTHLMRLRLGGARIPPQLRDVTPGAETFMYRFIAALRAETMRIQGDANCAQSILLMIDDLQFLIGKDNTQESSSTPSTRFVRRRQANCHLNPTNRLKPVRHREPAAHPSRLRHGGRHPPPPMSCGCPSCRRKRLRHGVITCSARIPRPQDLQQRMRELEGALNRLIAHANLFGRALLSNRRMCCARHPARA